MAYVCIQCGNITEKQLKRPLCSRKCYLDSIRRKKQFCNYCGRIFIPKAADRTDYCSRDCCFKAKAERKIERLNSEEYKAQRRKYRHERRSRLRGDKYESFKDIEIFERDKWVCGICGGKVKKSFKFPNPLSASLDHIVSVAVGGLHTRANTQLAHLGCNSRKGISVSCGGD